MKYYSATKNAFYAGEFRANYEQAGSWPGDAVEVGEEIYTEFSGPAPAGFRRVPGPDGLPAWEEIPPVPLADLKKGLQASVDRKAGEVRARFVSPGLLVDQEYLAAETAAQGWKDAGAPSDSVPPEVQCWADASGTTASEAAQDIIDTGREWRTVLSTIRAVRLQAKANIGNAGTHYDAQVAHDSAEADMDALEPA